MSNDAYGGFPKPTEERAKDVAKRIEDVRAKVKAAADKAKSLGGAQKEPRLVAISKLQLPSAIMAAHIEAKQVHFGENYVQELAEKAAVLPREIRWHFVGGLQSNKGKTLAAIPNLYLLETLDSIKAANILEKALVNHQSERKEALRVYIQVNTSGEDVKSGVDALLDEKHATSEHSLLALARHVILSCPHVRLSGVMTIGSAANSETSDASKIKTREEIIKANPDFERLILSRNNLVSALRKDDELKKALEPSTHEAQLKEYYKSQLLEGQDATGGLELSMGMSADVEVATMAGSDNVRVGSDCFGTRTTREEATKAMEEELQAFKK